jgi:hypothetical protein
MCVGIETYWGTASLGLPFHAHSRCSLIIHPLYGSFFPFLSFFFLKITLSVSYHHLAKHTKTKWLKRAIIYSHSGLSRLVGLGRSQLDAAGPCCFQLQVLLGSTLCDGLSSGLQHMSPFWDPGGKGRTSHCNDTESTGGKARHSRTFQASYYTFC